MIQWVTKRRLRNNDIMSVALRTFNGKMQLVFYGNLHKKITDHDYIQIGVDLEQNRIYFQSGTSVNGYKLHSNGNAVNIRSTNYFVEKLASYVGVYDLLFDDDQKLYYIQLGE